MAMHPRQSRAPTPHRAILRLSPSGVAGRSVCTGTLRGSTHSTAMHTPDKST